MRLRTCSLSIHNQLIEKSTHCVDGCDREHTGTYGTTGCLISDGVVSVSEWTGICLSGRAVEKSRSHDIHQFYDYRVGECRELSLEVPECIPRDICVDHITRAHKSRGCGEQQSSQCHSLSHTHTHTHCSI